MTCPSVHIDLKAVAKHMSDLPQVELPLEHHFSEGVYVRQISMPAGTYVIGKKHRTTHLNVIISGEVDLLVEGGEIVRMKAPFTFESVAGCQKALYILKDCVWQTIHTNPDNITDIQELEDRLVITDALECPEQVKIQ